MNIRPCTENDRDEVVRLWHDVFPDSPHWNRPEDDIDRKLSVQPELFIVAVAGGQVVGTAMAGFDGHRGWVYYVAVKPGYRQRGWHAAHQQLVCDGVGAEGLIALNSDIPRRTLLTRMGRRDIIFSKGARDGTAALFMREHPNRAISITQKTRSDDGPLQV